MSDRLDLLAHWTLWENSRGDLKVDGPHLAKTPGRDGIGYVEPVKVVRADALEGAVEASEVERLADAIERDKREPDKVLCHLALLRRLVLEARLAEASS